MKYLLILLMLTGIAKGQNANRVITGIGNFTWSRLDTCQRYEDSVRKYQKNADIWRSKMSATNDPGYNILLQEKVNALVAIRNDYLLKLKKCRP